MTPLERAKAFHKKRECKYPICHTVAVLETMWGWRGYSEAGERICYFRINPENHTGKRLYWFLGHESLIVTNACPVCVENANLHGKPDPVWLAENLKQLCLSRDQVLLICGKVAQGCYEECDFTHDGRTIYMPHPAARMWTREALDETRNIIQTGTGSLHIQL